MPLHRRPVWLHDCLLLRLASHVSFNMEHETAIPLVNFVNCRL